MKVTRLRDDQFLREYQYSEASNSTNNQGLSQKRTCTTLALDRLKSRSSISQSKLIDKFKKQTQELIEVKKAISIVSHSRLSQMKKLCSQKLINPESSNLYRTSHPQVKNSFFKTNYNRRVKVEDYCVTSQENRATNQTGIKHEQKILEQDKFEQYIQEFSHSDEISEIEHQDNSRSYNVPIKFDNPKPQTSDFTRKNRINNLPRSFSAHQLKKISNLAFAYKRQDTCISNQSHVFTVKSAPVSLRDRYEQRVKQAKEKILKNKIRIFENQTNFKLQKRIKQNLQTIDKQKTVSELIHSRMQRQRQKYETFKKNNEQKRLLLESRKMKVNIQRLSRIEFQQKELQVIRGQSEQSLLNMSYKNYRKQLEMVQKKQHLVARLEFMKGLEPGHLILAKNNIKTLQNSRVSKIYV